MAETFPKYYKHPYTLCSQCGGNGTCSGSSCFGDHCDYQERASANRYEGGYPTRYNDQSYTAQCRNQLPQQCNRVSPMWYSLSENGTINGESGSSYIKYSSRMPTWVGKGLRCGHYPIDNNAFYPNTVKYNAL